MFTKKQEGDFTTYDFSSAGYGFHVFYSAATNQWTVYRDKRGAQLRPMGKTFFRATDMIAHYKTAAVQLAMIAAEAGR